MVVVCGLGAEPLQPVTAPCILLSLQQPLGNTLQAMEAFAYGADEYVGKDVCLGVLAAFLPGWQSDSGKNPNGVFPNPHSQEGSVKSVGLSS